MATDTASSDSDGSDGFDVTISHRGDTVLMSVSGDVDLLTAPRLNKSLDAVMADSPTRVVMDLTDVSFLASSGMTVLIDASSRLGSAAHFGVVAAGPNTARPLELVGLDGTFTMYTTLDAALAAGAPAGDTA